MSSAGADGDEARKPRRGLVLLEDGRVAVALALAAFALAAWAVLRPTPQSTPAPPSPVSQPDYTRAGVERAQREMEKEHRLGEDLRLRDER